MGLGALALALGHACRLKPMPRFILVEELEKLGLEALLWGQSGVLVSDRLGPCQSLRVLGPVQAGLLLLPSPRPPPPTPASLTSLAVLPCEVFWTDAARAVWHVHTGAAPLAGVVCAAVV